MSFCGTKLVMESQLQLLREEWPFHNFGSLIARMLYSMRVIKFAPVCRTVSVRDSAC